MSGSPGSELSPVCWQLVQTRDSEMLAQEEWPSKACPWTWHKILTGLDSLIPGAFKIKILQMMGTKLFGSPQSIRRALYRLGPGGFLVNISLAIMISVLFTYCTDKIR